MARRRLKSNDEETTYWLSYSDMMAALLLIFVLIISFTMLQAKKQYETREKDLLAQQEVIKEQQDQLLTQKEKMEEQQALLKEQKEKMDSQQEQLDKIIGVRSELISALRDEFEGSELKVSVDPQTGAITFDSNVLFDSNKYDIKETGAAFLDEFLPRYFNILLKKQFSEYISEIIIEGHTDTRADYMYNLELSQQRALSVAKYCLDEKTSTLSKKRIKALQKIVTANGRSYSDPVYNEDKTVNMDASRRVEFKFRLKDEEMIGEMINILNSSDSED